MMARLAVLLLVLASSEALSAPMRARSVVVTPVITADAYADGDQIGTLTKIDNILGSELGAVHIESIQVIDKALVKDGIDILFFSYAITPSSADNAAVSITDADMASYFLGKVAIASADFTDTALNSFATNKPDLLVHGNSGNDLWMLLVCNEGTGCDWAATNDLAFRITYYD